MLRANDKIGPYILVRQLGKGAFGVVWLAEKRTAITTTKVALKLALDDEPDLDAIKQEADLWVHVGGHPNVLPMIDADIYDEQIVVVSEYAPDGSLEGWLKKHNGAAPSIESAIAMTVGILAGLEHLHAKKILHRDLKPANILLQGETPRLADFGLARVLKSSSHSGGIAGTPTYMSPEAFDGKRSEQSDIWAVGVILYQLLSGRLPFPAKDITSLIGAIIQRDPEPLSSSIHSSLQQVIARALEKDQTNRYQSANEMKVALQKSSRSIGLEIIHQSELPTERINEQVKPVSSSLKTIINTKIQAQSESPSFGYTTKANSPVAQKESISTGANRPPETEKVSPIIVSQILDKDQNHYSKTQTEPSSTQISKVAALILMFVIIVAFILIRTENTPDNATNTRDKAVNTDQVVAPLGMILIKGGSFKMGRNLGDKTNDEQKFYGPEHEVAVEPFFLDKTEVSNEDYKKFTDATKYTAPKEWKNGQFPSGSHLKPVTGVSWQDANAYAKWAGKRLPTETEWEYAARGTDGRIYPWGQQWIEGVAISEEMGAKSTQTVGSSSKGASPFGVLDMAGNVWEWTATTFYLYPGSKETLADKYKGIKIIRGGSFKSDKVSLTTYSRRGLVPDFTDSALGFRCAKLAQ